MNFFSLFALSRDHFGEKLDAWLLEQEIKRTERDLELTQKEIDEKLRAQGKLQKQHMLLKRELT